MIEQKDIPLGAQVDKIKEAVEEFFEKMTIMISNIEISLSSKNVKDSVGENRDVIDLDKKLDEPQILIGQQGQTLFEIQHLLRMILNKKLHTPLGTSNIFYLNLDINNYKKKKIEYLKDLAKELADQVSLTKEEKALLPMSAYERRIIHAELSQRTDIITESQGDGFDRHIVIRPR
jgi:spoIIIJ-associated protein